MPSPDDASRSAAGPRAPADEGGHDLIAVVTTVGNADDARRLARSLVERRLAACVQIDSIESVYVWNGALQHEPEWRLTAKTVAARYAEVEAAILESHPYELPAIHAVAVREASAAYAAWVAGESGSTLNPSCGETGAARGSA